LFVFYSIPMKIIPRILAFILLFSCFCTTAQAQFSIDAEGGFIPSTNYNKVRIPNRPGKVVNLPGQLDFNAKAFYRIRLGYTFAERHYVSLLYAPLTLKYEGSLPQTVNFNNQIFASNTPLEVFYKFNSYRLTYRYNFIQRGRWVVGAGLTAKIRDADIRFKNQSQDTHYDNVGFVPIINFYARYKPNYHWGFLVEGDALAAKQGRAEDIFAGVTYQINSTVGLKLGYRVLEGGANNDKIFNFSWINYASAGILISL
jgi:hypothetical protein